MINGKSQESTSKENKILIVDDTPENIDVLRQTLAPEGYKISVAPSGEKALQVAPRFVPDLILLDIMMPGINGLETCARIKNNPLLKDIPVIFISAKSEIEDIVEGFNYGGVDYISKPFRQEEVFARVKTHLKLKNLAKEKEQLIEELNTANEKLKDLASKDPLTGLLNRRSMDGYMEDEKARFMRNTKEFSFIIMDIDHFKKINDSLGHEAGDYVLVQIAKFLNKSIRRQDKLCRWGGEEFLLLLPETNLQGATELAEKLRHGLGLENFVYEKKKIPITMSFGVSVFDNKNRDLKVCIKNADDCLYQAKKDGRDRVVSPAGLGISL
jgi:diguanylate cyclase (GGDEF)-like protein